MLETNLTGNSHLTFSDQNNLLNLLNETILNLERIDVLDKEKFRKIWKRKKK